MEEDELRKVAKCNVCGKPIGHTGLPFFWRVRLERYGLKLDAIRRQDGLTMMLGDHAALARVMGPNEDMTKTMLSVEITVCETCAMKPEPVMVLAELGCKENKEGEEDE